MTSMMSKSTGSHVALRIALFSSDLHSQRPRRLPGAGPQCVHIFQREVVLGEMQPESARLGQLQHPSLAPGQPGLFYGPQPPAQSTAAEGNDHLNNLKRVIQSMADYHRPDASETLVVPGVGQPLQANNEGAYRALVDVNQPEQSS